MIPADLAEDLQRRLVAAQAEERLPAVSASLGRDGSVAWSSAAGLADVESGREASSDDQYRIGSITKLITAVAIMQLRDDGLLDLDDAISLHVPEATQRGPTIRRMLSHTSGLQREIPGDVWVTMQIPSREEVIERLSDVEQVLDPGGHWHYSNLAYSLLGEVVARLRDATWWEVVQTRVLTPLGMRRTTWDPAAPTASGYLVAPYSDQVSTEAPIDCGGFGPAGQLWSTPSDLLALGDFLAAPGDSGVLAKETVEEMHRIHGMADPDWTTGWGLGPVLHRRGDRFLAGHDGAMPGFQASLLYHRDRRMVAAVTTSSGAGNDPFELAAGMLEHALSELPKETKPWEPGAPPPPELATALGRWWSEGEEFVFMWRGGALEARAAGAPAGKPPAVFEREAPDRYRGASGREQGELLLLLRGDDGDVAELRWAGYRCTREPSTFSS